MKALIVLVLLVGIGFGVYYKMGRDGSKQQSGIRVGATVEEVDKILGPPQRVLPQFGGELRVYKAQSGRQYMLIFANGELVEIQG
jgi:hypothetical protein